MHVHWANKGCIKSLDCGLQRVMLKTQCLSCFLWCIEGPYSLGYNRVPQSVVQDNDSSLLVNMLFGLRNTLCRGFLLLSMIESILLRVLFSATDVRGSSSMPTPEHAILTSQSIPILNAASPANHCVEENTGSYWLVEHRQAFIADLNELSLLVKYILLCPFL